MTYVFAPADQTTLPISGSRSLFPVHRIYCIGQNYAAHAAEMKDMGVQPRGPAPLFFTKPADAIVPGGGPIPYPSKTENLHHEVELVVALSAAGQNLTPSEAKACIFGYGVGLDLTRRDLQADAKKSGAPWDVAKGFDYSAPIAPLHPADDIDPIEHANIWLDVNGERRQDATISDMLWSVPEIIAHLSQYFALIPGDVIFTGTPAGVGPITIGDRVRCGINGLGILEVEIVEPI